uniref:Uncharacterized protein n=1 Tax=Salarias fasciatus TaxID=181472 RepID=A0A672GTH4_SALFA
MLKWKSRQNGNVCQKGSRRTGGRRNSSRRNGNFRVDEMSVNQLVMVSCCVPDNCLDRSALHVAAFEGRLLLRHDLLGADVDTVTVDNVSALHEACLSGHYESAKLLLENGADPDRVTLAGGTPLFYACSSGNAACVQLILERGSSPHAGRRRASPIHEAAKKNHQERLQLLLSWGAQVDLELPLGGTPLDCACMAAARCPGGQTGFRLGCGQDGPLHAAVRGGAAQIVTLLLDFGADECCRNEDGQTPPDLLRWLSRQKRMLKTRLNCSVEELSFQ